MISCVRWNPINGNWFLTGSKDCHIKVYDLRKANYEINCYACKEDPVQVVAWHPHKEELFASGTQKGAVAFWTA